MKSTSKGRTLDADLSRRRKSEYATAEEFCTIFDSEMKPLYTLALLLTGTHEKAEQCFVAALEECRRASIFKNWALSWSRLAVIENAIHIARPVLGATAGSTAVGQAEADQGTNPNALPVMRLNTFHRFIFVLSVLDRYSVRDCAILLKCAWRDAERARQRAVEFIAATGRQVLAPSVQVLRSSASL